MDKIQLIYDHYKESMQFVKKSERDRNNLFIILTILIAILFLCSNNSKEAIATFKSLFLKLFNINLCFNFSIIQSFIWFTLLLFSLRYYQINTYIEREYTYIHKLENIISTNLNIEFDRESSNYLNNYPLFLNFIYLLYTWIFPIIYCTIIVLKIILELSNIINILSCTFDVIICFFILLLTIFYLLLLHKKE